MKMGKQPGDEQQPVNSTGDRSTRVTVNPVLVISEPSMQKRLEEFHGRGISSCGVEQSATSTDSIRGEDHSRAPMDAPTPHRKRGQEQLGEVAVVDSDASDVEIIDIESLSTCRTRRKSALACIPCEICKKAVPFERYEEHVSTHSVTSVHKKRRSNSFVEVPCDACGQMVAFKDFAEHASTHCTGVSRASKSKSSNAVPCTICSALVEPEDMADHQAAHAVHEELMDADLQNSTSEVDITMQVVDMARKGGAGLPGNKSFVKQGDAVLVRWSDGHWYKAHLVLIHPDGRHNISWDPPYHAWAPEDANSDAVIPRMDQAREVCNFDVALSFINKLHKLKKKTSALELVYHWTREENVGKIIENNLKTPGSTNADGSKVELKNGAVYGSGIYAATSMNFGAGYGAGLSCAFLCLANPGSTKVCLGPAHLGTSDDSLQHGQLRVYRSSDQLLPLFFTDRQRSAQLEQCAQQIAGFLQQKVEVGFREGAWVYALDKNHWYQAEVVAANADGSYAIKWLPPYEAYGYASAVPAANLRKCK